MNFLIDAVVVFSMMYDQMFFVLDTAIFYVTAKKEKDVV